jgi:hypothetical protein
MYICRVQQGSNISAASGPRSNALVQSRTWIFKKDFTGNRAASKLVRGHYEITDMKVVMDLSNITVIRDLMEMPVTKNSRHSGHGRISFSS